jgi:hypothetical protein
MYLLAPSLEGKYVREWTCSRRGIPGQTILKLGNSNRSSRRRPAIRQVALRRERSMLERLTRKTPCGTLSTGEKK